MKNFEGHRKRIKEKYLLAGIDGWHEYEILELLLTFSIPRKDTKAIAKSLIKKFGSINNVLDADINDILSVEGVGKNSAVLFKLVKDLQKIYLSKRLDSRTLITSPSAACDYLMSLLKGEKNEKIVVLYLNKGNKPLKFEVMQEGTVDRAPLYPRKVVERALKYNASAIIIAHNHPGGTLYASEQDKEITRILKDAVSTFDIKLLDHIIIGDGNGADKKYFSFKEEGLL
ncbi:MAG: DNA repair protein RadC [Candidatus Schekmanbacteria bacterium]|nr:MAG: DNA repair protein RadC [Candidatus Schekmanbacteria bacterium]